MSTIQFGTNPPKDIPYYASIIQSPHDGAWFVELPIASEEARATLAYVAANQYRDADKMTYARVPLAVYNEARRVQEMNTPQERFKSVDVDDEL